MCNMDVVSVHQALREFKSHGYFVPKDYDLVADGATSQNFGAIILKPTKVLDNYDIDLSSQVM